MSVQWLSRHWNEAGDAPGLIVIDEAHHALAASYTEMWKRYPAAKKLGVTATPCRLNRRGFTELFEVLVTSWSIAEFIEKGVLSVFDYVSIRPGSEEQRLIDGLEKRGVDGDYQVKEMDAHTVPFSKYPSYLPEGVLGMCTEGNAEIQIGLRKYVICANDILIFMPGFLVSFIKSSLTFTIDYCTFSNALFYDVINGSIKRFPTGFHTYTQTHCIYSLSQEKAEQFSLYFRLLYNRATSPTYLFTKESITNLLKLPFLELYADYYSTVKEHKVTTLHKEEIGYFFLDLLLKHYKENKEVAFYAEKLHVSSKYLTEALTLVSGKSPKEWIIHYTLQEIYALLENPSISIQEIVQRTRFANLATLRRFFKRHTGTSLLQYRKQDLYKNNQQ